MATQNYIDRPPRIQPELPEGQFEIPSPPQIDENTNQPLLQLALPMVTIVGYILVSMFGKGRSPLLIIPMALAVVATSLMSFYTYRRTKQINEQKNAAYAQRLIELRKEMDSYHDVQRTFYYYNYPEPETTLRIASDLGKSASERKEDSRSGSRLWERRSTDPDFGKVRLGTGAVPSTVIYKLPQIDDYSDPRISDAIRLSEDCRYVKDVSITIPLREPPKQMGEEGELFSKHSVGIAGSNPEGMHSYIRSLLVDLAAFHQPNDLKIYIIGSYEARQYWRWAYSLPQCKESNRSETLCFEEEQEKKDEKEVDKLTLYWKNLRNILERRKIRLEDETTGPEVTLPFMVVVVDVMSALPEWSSLRDLEANATISTILNDGPRLGAAIFFLVPERSKVPSSCRAIIEVDVDAKLNGHAVFRYAETDLNTLRYVGRADLVNNQDLAREFARKLEPLAVRASYGTDLATSITLLELLRLGSIDELQALAKENWTISKFPKSADWMNVNIGLLSGNEVRRLVFSAKADGVHGMIAGSTGSGKSELLMTLIMGLAINFDPSVINFVLVDYKGGAAFEPFRNLPHVVDIVTNLEGSATARMFASIKAELDRRQKLNTYTDSKDIVHYRKKGLHTQEGTPPYPFLFVIIDEFAEMISGNAEFKSQLESITRLGRALGVSLILAAQRPTGVTDQMRANIKYRICLRVETPEESRELLRRGDAAYLPPGIPGRGYLQIGNENIEMIQVGYIGGDYLGPQQNVSPNVIWVDRPKKQQARAEEAPKLYDVAVNMLTSLAKAETVKPQWRPWPAFLPRSFSLQSPVDLAYMGEADVALLRSDDHGAEERTGAASDDGAGTVEPSRAKEQGPVLLPLNSSVEQWLDSDRNPRWKGIDWVQNAMRPVVGLVDNPYDAKQVPMVVKFPVGHAVLFSASGWGKTTFLRTVIMSLVSTHSPDELQVYIMDFGGRNLAVFKELPHVGAIITSEEEERIQRLLRRLESILEKRQALMSEAGATDIYTFNSRNPDKVLPAILVVIDNFAEFRENFENMLPTVIGLVREARAYGIHFVITADLPGALTNKLFNVITERMCLKLTDPSEYANIVGRGVPDMGAIAGRGYLRSGRTPLEFQVALPVSLSEEDLALKIDETEKLKRAVLRMKTVWAEGWKGEPPAIIETLPTRVSLERAVQMRAVAPTKRIQALLGIDDFDLALYRVDLQKLGPHMVVIGPANSGKTTTLRTLALSLAYNHSPDELIMVLVDFQRRFADYGGKYKLSDMPHVVQTITKSDELEEMLLNVQAECKDFATNPGRRKVYIIIDNYDSFSDEGYKKTRKSFDEMAVMVREYATAGLHFIAGGSLQMFSAMEELRKQIQASNFGVGLQTADAAAKLNGRVPRALAEAELPMGRGFIVKSGRTTMVQVATPYSSDDNIEGSLDAWIEQIKKRHPVEQVKWLRVPEPGAAKGDDGGIPAKPASPAKAVPTTAELEAIKAKLKTKGYGVELLAALSPDDIMKVAIQYGFDKPTPEPAVADQKPAEEAKPAAKAKHATEKKPAEEAPVAQEQPAKK